MSPSSSFSAFLFISLSLILPFLALWIRTHTRMETPHRQAVGALWFNVVSFTATGVLKSRCLVSAWWMNGPNGVCVSPFSATRRNAKTSSTSCSVGGKLFSGSTTHIQDTRTASALHSLRPGKIPSSRGDSERRSAIGVENSALGV